MPSVVIALGVVTYSVLTYKSAWHESVKAGTTSTVLIWFALWVLLLKLRLWQRRRAFRRLA
jgi:hypothetical protein